MSDKKRTSTGTKKSSSSSRNTGSKKPQGTGSKATNSSKNRTRTRTNTAASASTAKDRSTIKARTTSEKSFQSATGLLPLWKEITLLLSFVVCVIMFLGNFGIAGIFGKWLSIICMDIAGAYLGYVFPIILFAGIFLIMRYWYDIECWIKTVGVVLFFFGLLEFMQVIAKSQEEIKTMLPFNMIFNDATTVGGIPAVFAAKLLLPAIGKAGTVVAMIVVCIIGVLLVTGRSLIEMIEKASDNARSSAESEREYNQRRAEERRLRREEMREENERRNQERQQREAALKERQAQKEALRKRIQTAEAEQEEKAPQRKAVATPQTPIPEEHQFERPNAAKPRQVLGVAKNVRMKPEMPRDTEAVEMSVADSDTETPVIQVTAKKKGNGQTVKRMTSDLDLQYGGELYPSKIDEEVEPPTPIKPTLKPRKDNRTTAEIFGTKTSGEENPIPIFGQETNPLKPNIKGPQITIAGAEPLYEQPLMPSEPDKLQETAPKQPQTTQSIKPAANPLYTQASDEALQQLDQEQVTKETLAYRGDEDGYRTVVDGNGKVIKRRMNSIPGEVELTPSEKHDLTPKEDDSVPILKTVPKKDYKFPSKSLLKANNARRSQGALEAELRETAAKLEETLNIFGVNAHVENISCGPTVTRFEVKPELGVKVSKVLALTDDIKLNLAAADIRIEAPIPGKAAIGIEVPNKEVVPVMFSELINSPEFENAKSKLTFAVGKDISGNTIVTDIAKMPHLLIAGQTGSGKSVSINTLIISLLYKATPEEVKLIMIDPKVVELCVYNGIPHLLTPVVTDPKRACGALNWAVCEMEERYQLFSKYGVRDLKGYNDHVEQVNESLIREGKTEDLVEKKPQLVIIVDELADLMMAAPGDIEDAIIRLAQKARAAGIHLIIATQRPSVNVITGLIKANVPSRIAFSVSQGVDSRTILDMNGAEKLLGKGDMLFYPYGFPKPIRVQGAFVSDEEVQAIVDSIREQDNVKGGENTTNIEAAMNNAQIADKKGNAGNSSNAMAEENSDNGFDELFIQSGRFLIDKDKASIGMLQRMFRIGFNRAARIMDQLAEAGVVGPEEGTKPRRILMTAEEFENFVEENGL